MPYVTSSERKRLDPLISPLLEAITSRGELNYCITALVAGCVSSHTYSGLEAAIGTLECVKQEFYRRVLAPYEERKRDENGDVY